jgi:hypothetical protein
MFKLYAVKEKWYWNLSDYFGKIEWIVITIAYFVLGGILIYQSSKNNK